jgi:uncharacterized membrane protein YphA (DoxX/SURF4 family)
MANKANRSFMSWALWIAQALLALLFLMSGVSKLFSSVELLGDRSRRYRARSCASLARSKFSAR